jgi:hypothetical protein
MGQALSALAMFLTTPVEKAPSHRDYGLVGRLV